MLTTVLLSLCLGSIFLLAFNCFLNPRKANTVGNQWLGLSFICFGFALLSDLLEILAIIQRYPFINVLSEITRLAMAPAFYLSVLFFTTPNRTFKKRDWLHFIPFFLFIINCSPVFFAHPPYFSNRLDAYEAGRYVRVFMFMVIKLQVIVYWIMSYLALVRHQRNIKLIFSSLQPVDLKWLNYLLISLLFAVLIWLNQNLFQIQWINDYSTVGYLVIIYSLSYSVLRQREVFSFPVNESKEIESIITHIDSPKQERLPSDQLESLILKLRQLMETGKCFLNSDLELPDLAVKMNLSTHELSYLLNTGIACNFFEFINSYRVEEAKRLLVSQRHQHLNILAIANEAGFNSKTTFNTAFKKMTGLSPSQFRKQAEQGQDQLIPDGSPIS